MTTQAVLAVLLAMAITAVAVLWALTGAVPPVLENLAVALVGGVLGASIPGLRSGVGDAGRSEGARPGDGSSSTPGSP